MPLTPCRLPSRSDCTVSHITLTSTQKLHLQYRFRQNKNKNDVETTRITCPYSSYDFHWLPNVGLCAGTMHCQYITVLTLSNAPKLYLCPRISRFIASVGKQSTLPMRIASMVMARYWHHIILSTRLPSSMYVYDVRFVHRRCGGCEHETWLCSLWRFSCSIWTVSLLQARTDLNLHYVKILFLNTHTSKQTPALVRATD